VSGEGSLETAELGAGAASFWARAVEFLLVGGGTLFLLPLAFLLRARLGLDESEFVVGFLMFHAATVINNPHFAVTYLLFYRDLRARAFGAAFVPRQRLRYWLVGFVVPAALSVWLGFALVDHSARKLGLLIQLMFFLVGWHYVKQGFGVLTVLSLRRGVRFSAFERKVVLAHCFAGWLFARTNPRDLGRESVVDDVLYTSLPQPPGLDHVMQLAFASSAALLVGMLITKWRREGSLPLTPLLGFLVTVWLWTAFSRVDPLLVYVIPALHSLQYLYFVWLLRRNGAREAAGALRAAAVPRSLALWALAAIGLGWLFFRGAPALLDGFFVLVDPIDSLGTTPYLAGFGAFVNIHHYFMDTVIWRRENPETRLLAPPLSSSRVAA
jgi:hypothetical protein